MSWISGPAAEQRDSDDPTLQAMAEQAENFLYRLAETAAALSHAAAEGRAEAVRRGQ
ncbi:MAG: hypothetical protein JWP40_3794 [Blastococcus sp.]|nr:hypothetical protein [Blastococcus sp.]